MTDTLDLNPQIDPVVPAGSPNTVAMPLTGHVLSLPKPGETFEGYAWRVHRQAGAGDADVRGAIMLAVPSLGDVGDRANWPLMADKFFNSAAYNNKTNTAHAAPQGSVHAAPQENNSTAPRIDLAQFSTDDLKAILRLTGTDGMAGFYSSDGLTPQQRINAAWLQGGQGKGSDTQPGSPASTFVIGPNGYQITPQVQAYLDQLRVRRAGVLDANKAASHFSHTTGGGEDSLNRKGRRAELRSRHGS